MRLLLRYFTFSYISVFIVQRLFGSFDYDTQSVVLLTLGLALVNILSRPLYKSLSIGQNVVTSFFLSVLLNFAIIYAVTFFIPSLNILPTDTPNLLILGFMLPSKHLTGLWSGVAAAAFFTLILNLLNWLCKCKKE